MWEPQPPVPLRACTGIILPYLTLPHIVYQTFRRMDSFYLSSGRNAALMGQIDTATPRLRTGDRGLLHRLGLTQQFRFT
jgi:hypothetical protein